jgi:hypothetical protein
MRKRRMPRSKKMYDLCFRSLRGLPLPARALTTLLIESIMGRLLRTEAIIVCSYVWMSNHVHMQVFSLDCQALTFSVGGLLPPPLSATLPSFSRIAPHGAEDEIPPPRECIVLHV